MNLFYKGSLWKSIKVQLSYFYCMKEELWEQFICAAWCSKHVLMCVCVHVCQTEQHLRECGGQSAVTLRMHPANGGCMYGGWQTDSHPWWWLWQSGAPPFPYTVCLLHQGLPFPYTVCLLTVFTHQGLPSQQGGFLNFITHSHLLVRCHS